MRGFTLIELMVVISVIALLAAMLMSGVSTVRTNARSAVCKSNLRQLGLSFSTYLNDNEGFWPTDYWNQQLTPFLQNESGPITNSTFSTAATYAPARCPATPRKTTVGAELGLTYAYAAQYYDGGSISDPLFHVLAWVWWAVPNPPRIHDARIRLRTQKAVLSEDWDDINFALGQASWGKSQLNNMQLRRVHGTGSNVLCTDGHVQIVTLPAVAMFSQVNWYRDPMWLPYNPAPTTRMK